MIFGMMKNKIYISICFIVFSILASSVNAMEIAALMDGLSKNKHKKSNYLETKHAFYLEKPLISEGTIEFRQPDILVKTTIKPHQLVQEYSNNSIRTIEGNGSESYLDLNSQPAIAILFKTILGVITGDEKILKKYFNISTIDHNVNWTLNLVPKEAYLKSWFKTIVVSGSHHNIKQIKIVEANDDMTIMDINEAR